VECRRIAWDVDADLDRVRAGCFVCGLLSSEPGHDHDVVHRDDVGVVFRDDACVNGVTRRRRNSRRCRGVALCVAAPRPCTR